MNAPQPISRFPSPFGEPVTGDLLFAGFQMTDTLQLDLYGYKPTGECGYEVTGVSVSTDANHTDISELLSAKQLDAMGEWLDHKDVMGGTAQRIAANAKHEAVRIKF